jgi:hypothetical protein
MTMNQTVIGKINKSGEGKDLTGVFNLDDHNIERLDLD